MNQKIPNVVFKKNQELCVEVMDFQVLYKKLVESKDHDPFETHQIGFYLILVVIKNSYTHFLDFHFYHLQEGSALFVAKNQIQRFSKSITKAKGYGIVFNTEFLNKHYFLTNKLQLNRLFNYHIESPLIHQKELGNNDFFGIAKKLHEEYATPNNLGKSEILGSLLNVLLIKAERAKEFRKVIDVNRHRLKLFGQFKVLLEKKYMETRNSKKYAAMLNISYKFLNDVAKELTGKTAKAFIDTYVTIEIKRYLVTTPLSIKEISHKTGFDEPANMIKFFKKNTGATPLKFRKQ
ncbi:helix-turn-helix domain-containing protein [Croceitalea marina]|uniref:Helix-turn-helix domain-containing protein n=1 Tax=Croceitalea marina TaxID=1775166 RepID=A0ABW5MXX6_9FLAO